MIGGIFLSIINNNKNKYFRNVSIFIKKTQTKFFNIQPTRDSTYSTKHQTKLCKYNKIDA